jgi:uncharacterized protein YbjQ (UPF0145 family)
MILATADTLHGQHITRSLGLVVACIPYLASTYAEGIKDLQGNVNPDVPSVLEARRLDVIERLAKVGSKVGADAIVAVRMDVREISPTWRELCAYGTAVVVLNPVRRGP